MLQIKFLRSEKELKTLFQRKKVLQIKFLDSENLKIAIFTEKVLQIRSLRSENLKK